MTLDVDGLSVEVHGKQPGREGQVHSASGGLDFLQQVLARVEKEVCEVAAVRFDAAFPPNAF